MAGVGWQGWEAAAPGWGGGAAPRTPRPSPRPRPLPRSPTTAPPTKPAPLLPPPPPCPPFTARWLEWGGTAALHLPRAGEGWRRPPRRPPPPPRPAPPPPPPPAPTKPAPLAATTSTLPSLHITMAGVGWHCSPAPAQARAGGGRRRGGGGPPRRRPAPRRRPLGRVPSHAWRCAGAPSLALPCGSTVVRAGWGWGGVVGAGMHASDGGAWALAPPWRPPGSAKCRAGAWAWKVRMAAYKAGLQPCWSVQMRRQFASGAVGPRSSRGEVKQPSRRLPAAAALQSLPSDRPLDFCRRAQ